jgi:uncharacterized membrane protein YqgA involved in biofilm formation
MTGPWINSAAILTGSLAGHLLRHHIPTRLRDALRLNAGLCSIGLGIANIAKVHNLGAMVVALLLGSLIGELLGIERAITSLGDRLRKSQDTAFSDTFIPALLLFSLSGTGIFGAMREGMTADPSILIAKACLDLITAAIFATQIGIIIAAVALPQLAVQLSLAALATLILPLTTPTLIADFSAVGGLIMLATGLRICGIASFAIANLLPGLLLAMPASALWSRLLAP